MRDECIFCRIIDKKLRSEMIYEDDLIFAFLDIGPLRPGHTQIASREHISVFEELPTPTANRVLEFGQRLARAMKVQYGVERVAFLFTGGDVPHAHAHVLPMHEKTDITSRHYIAEQNLTFRDVTQATTDELAAEGSRLRRRLASHEVGEA